jgi:GDP-L-fucose synthase
MTSDAQFSVLTPQSAIFVAGHRGMVGSAVVRCLKVQGCENIITKTHKDLDLTEQSAVRGFFQREKIDYVVIAAAKVGGIHANNSYPAEFIYKNLMIEANVIHEAYRAGIRRLLFLGSSCIYPKNAPQPMKEEYLLTGYLEPTNEPYAIAKIAGIKLCESYNRQYGTKYRSLMPTNLYGPNDNYDLLNSHVLPAMIRKFHLAKLAAQGNWDGINKDEARYGTIPEDIRSVLRSQSAPPVVLWGTGMPRREFLHVDDLASACVFAMKLDDETYEHYTQQMLSHINIGAGEDNTIAELADMVKEAVGFEGQVIWDSSKPDGMPKKLLDVSLAARIGWTAKISLKDGIQRTYQDYLKDS